MHEVEVDSGSAREHWRRARTFDDLCRLGARFVEGELAYFPGWGSPTLDEESDAIAAHLARFQRAGFLTVASQPGAVRGGTAGVLEIQRAFVCGFADARAARSLAASRAASGISIALFDRGDGPGERTPVTLVGGAARVFAGHAAFAEELECFAEHLSDDALRALRSSTYVSAIDLEWGRNSELWPFLDGALTAK
jgi:hypothetical protein